MEIQQSEQYVGDNWWKWSVWIEGRFEELDVVEFVDWQLDPTFTNPIRRVTDRSTKFRLNIGGWGAFMIHATAQRKDGTAQKLRHYLQLHFPGMVSEEVFSAIQSLLATKSEVGPPSDDEARDAKIVSEISSGLQALRKKEVNPDVMAAAPSRSTSLMQSLVERSATEKAGQGMTGSKYGTWDLAWTKTAVRFVASQVFGKKAEFRTADPQPTPIPNRLRAAVFGDWATGVYGAPLISTSIARDPARFDLVLNLGNTFYSGTEHEIRERLLALWPRVPGAINRTLNGNHDMYSGGQGYFEIALPEFRQQASYFALQNDYWILAALDTAYADHDVYGDQVEWLKHLLSNGANRRLVLFTHHQPFSLYDLQGSKLVLGLNELLRTRRIFAWYWSHEHACILYNRHPAWEVLGRCLGFGGIPYRRRFENTATPGHLRWVVLDGDGPIPGAQLLDGPNPYILGHEEEYGPHGYAVLEFDGSRLRESIRLADGTMISTRELTS